MLFLAIIAFMLVLLSFFSLLTAINEHAGLIWQSIILALSLALTVFAIIKLPYWNHSESNQPVTSKVTKSTSIKSRQSQPFSVSGSTTNVQTQSLKEKNVLEQLQQSYKKFGTISFEGSTHTYTIVPTNSNFDKAISYLEKHPSKTKAVRWPEEISNTKKTGQSVTKVLGNGYSMILKKNDGKTTLLKIKDGKLTYDKFAD